MRGGEASAHFGLLLLLLTDLPISSLRLWENELDSMISPSGNPVPAGQACMLKDGEEVLLSKDDRGRMVSIRMIP